MIVVQLPNGDQAQFPDGMADADIEAVLQREYGPNSRAAHDAQAVDAGAANPSHVDFFANAQPVMKREDQQTQSSVIDPLMQGLTFGWADELRGLAWGAGDALTGGDFGAGYERGVDNARTSLERERRLNPIGSTVAEFAGAIPTGVGLGGQVVARGAGVGARMLSGAMIGAGQGAAYGAGAAHEDRATGAALGLTTGGVLGAAAPVVGTMARRLVTPAPANAAQTAAARTMADEGITLSAGQQTGNKGMQYLESELGRGAAEALLERQSEEFTSAVLRRIGVDAARATPEVLEDAYRGIGQQFDNLAMVTNTPFDTTLQNNLLNIAADYVSNAGTPAPVVENMVNRIGQLAQQNGGRLTGQTYQEMRSTIGRLSRSTDPTTAMALRVMQDALDDAVERHLSGQTLQAWRDARRAYQNYLVVERAVTSAGEKAAAGLITPAQLRTAAVNQNRRAFAHGSNDYAELARAGIQTMTPLPQSGTAPRLAAQAMNNLPALIGAGLGAPAGPWAAIAGATAGYAIPRAVGGAMLSRPGRALLANQLAGGSGAGVVENAIRTGTPVISGEVGDNAPLRIVVQRDR